MVDLGDLNLNITDFSSIWQRFDNASISECPYHFETYMSIKFPLIGIFGTLLASLGVAANTALTLALLRNRECRNSYMLYLAAISIGDWFRCFLYLMIFSGEIYFNWFRWYYLYIAWTHYTVPIFPVAHMAGLATAYHLIAASIERYLLTSEKHIMCTVSSRLIAILGVFAFAGIYSMPMYFALGVMKNPNCTYWDYGYVYIYPTSYGESWAYGDLYSTYLNNFFQIVLPFGVLLVLNFAIIVRLKASIRLGSAMFGQFALAGGASKRQQAKLRSATITLVALISGYLIANFPSVILLVFEKFTSRDFQAKHSMAFTFAVDGTTLMHVVNASTRFSVYVACNKIVRQEFFKVIHVKKLLGRHKSNEVEATDLRIFKSKEDLNDNENGHIKVVSQESLRLLGADC